MAIKAKDYNALLLQELPVASDRHYLRQRLDTFVVLQFLAGPKEQRVGFGGFWLRLIAWITLIGTPVLILLQGQVTFLPYHHEWIVWFQRVVVLIDLAVIWLFWIQLRNEDDSILRRVSTKARMYLGGGISFGVFIFSGFLATFPGEWLNEHMPELRYVPTSWPPHWPVHKDWTSLHVLLFEGEVDEVTSRPRSVFSNRLVLMDQSFVSDPDKLDKGPSFRGRDLNRAVLSRADLRKADFTGAMLNGAKLNGAKLQSALFVCGQPRSYLTGDRPSSGCAWLQGAELSEAQLQGANLSEAKLQGATLTGAELQGANLHGAQLQLALLMNTQLQGATLDFAKMERALLFDVDLQGASLNEAHLQGASFFQANLQGASLRGARLWRAQGEGTKLEFADLENIDLEHKPTETHESFIEWRAAIAKSVGSRAIKALEQLDPAAQEQTEDYSNVWKTARSMQPKGDEGERKRGGFLATLACSSPAPDVARALTFRLLLEGVPRDRDVAGGLKQDRHVAGKQFFVDQLRKGKFDPAACPGVQGFTNRDWNVLSALSTMVLGQAGN